MTWAAHDARHCFARLTQAGDHGGNKQVAQQKYCSGLQTQELAGTGEAPLREAGI